MMKKNCTGSPFCALLDPKTRELLCRHATMTYLMPKQIQTQHSQDQLEIVAEGALLKYMLFEDGSQESIDIISDGEIIGEHILLGDSPKLDTPHLLETENPNYFEYQTLALTKVTICNYPIDLVRTLFTENQQFARAILQSISQRLLRYQINEMKIRSFSGHERVEYAFKVLKNLNVDIKTLTQEELVLIIGVSRNTLVRALKTIKV